MPEGDLPKPVVPTTPTEMTSPDQAWSEYFGDAEEWQYMINDCRQRHHAVLLQDGDDFYWLKRKLSGTKCAYWIDQTRQCGKPLDSKSKCYNTGYIGGYEAPLQIKIALPNANRQAVADSAGLIKMEPMRSWTIWTPQLTDRDVVVNRVTGERFEVVGVTLTGKWRGLFIAQFFDLRALQNGVDYAWQVPVDTVL